MQRPRVFYRRETEPHPLVVASPGWLSVLGTRFVDSCRRLNAFWNMVPLHRSLSAIHATIFMLNILRIPKKLLFYAFSCCARLDLCVNHRNRGGPSYPTLFPLDPNPSRR